MLAYFEVEELNGIMELNEENLAKAEEIRSGCSGMYCSCAVAIEWDEKRKMPCIYLDGPF